MSPESVRAFFRAKVPDIGTSRSSKLTTGSATVELAAKAHGVEAAQIAKTICLAVRERRVLVVTSGTAHLDNRKVKDVPGGKGRMLDPEQVRELTSHPAGGVCPFGLPSPLPIYCDVSLRRFNEVVPAAGATNAAVRISPERLAELTDATWVDICR